MTEGKVFTSCCLLFLAAGLCTEPLGRGVSRSIPVPQSSLPRPAAGYCGLCQGWGVTQQGRKGNFVLGAFCETGRCCQQFNKLCLSSKTPLNLDLSLIRQSSHVLSGHMYYLKNIYKGLMYSGAPLTQISIISSAKSQNSPAYSKKCFSSVCLYLNLEVGKMLGLQYLFIYRTLVYPVKRHSTSSDTAVSPLLSLNFLFCTWLAYLHRGSQSFWSICADFCHLWLCRLVACTSSVLGTNLWIRKCVCFLQRACCICRCQQLEGPCRRSACYFYMAESCATKSNRAVSLHDLSVGSQWLPLCPDSCSCCAVLSFI